MIDGCLVRNFVFFYSGLMLLFYFTNPSYPMSVFSVISARSTDPSRCFVLDAINFSFYIFIESFEGIPGVRLLVYFWFFRETTVESFFKAALPFVHF